LLTAVTGTDTTVAGTYRRRPMLQAGKRSFDATAVGTERSPETFGH